MLPRFIPPHSYLSFPLCLTLLSTTCHIFDPLSPPNNLFNPLIPVGQEVPCDGEDAGCTVTRRRHLGPAYHVRGQLLASPNQRLTSVLGTRWTSRLTKPPKTAPRHKAWSAIKRTQLSTGAPKTKPSEGERHDQEAWPRGMAKRHGQNDSHYGGQQDDDSVLNVGCTFLGKVELWTAPRSQRTPKRASSAQGLLRGRRREIILKIT